MEVPGLLSFLAHNDFDTNIKGVNTLVPEYQEKYGTHYPDEAKYGDLANTEINYVPIMPVTYWGFRMMIGFGGIAALAAAVALWVTRKGTVPQATWLMRLAIFGILAPFGANAAGWIFTEMGRQPFVVAPNPAMSGVDQVFMFTASAVSRGVSMGEMIFSLVALGTVYAVLLVVEVKLLTKYIRGGVVSAMPELDQSKKKHDDEHGPGAEGGDDVLAFAY